MKVEKSVKKGRGAQIDVHNRFEKNELVQEHWEGIDENTADEDIKRTRYLEVFPKSIVNRVDSADIPMDWSMNPYQGCEHGCIYCYARNSHTYWGYSPGAEFENIILVKKNAPELLDKKLKGMKWQGEPIMFSGNTDCYQPVERKLEITRKCLKVFLKHKHPVGLITKNDLILRDLDLIQELAKDRLVSVAVSINSLDEKLRRKLEPRTSTGLKRMELVRKLADAGVLVNVLLAPVIPYLNHHEIPTILKAANEAGASDIHYIMVRLNHQTGTLFKDWIERHFPDRSEKVLNQIRAMHGGNLNDSYIGRRMKGAGKEAEVISKLFEVSKRKYFTTKPLYKLRTSRLQSVQMNLFDVV